jgi:ribokinase
VPRLVVCGAINWDISCFVEHLPSPGEEVRIEHIVRVSGGTGGNVAVASARILGAKEVALIGALGEDGIARQQVAALEAEGVMVDGISHISGEESGQAYILIDREGQNVIASGLGANTRLRPQHLRKPPMERLLQECEGLAITDPSLDIVAELIALAKRRSISVLWDPGILVSHGWEALQLLAKQVDVFLLNQTEALTLWGNTELNMRLEHLRALGFRNHVVLKLGAEGATMLETATGVAFEIPALPLEEMGLEVVNTAGCGDVFVGTFAAYRVLGSSLQKSLLMADIAAGLNATRPETRGSPSQADLEAAERRSRGLGFVVGEHRLSRYS